MGQSRLHEAGESDGSACNRGAECSSGVWGRRDIAKSGFQTKGKKQIQGSSANCSDARRVVTCGVLFR